jgi:hypothetical protein
MDKTGSVIVAKPNPVASIFAMTTTKSRLRIPAALQSLYFLGSGIWPLVHMPSFLAVTGPKDDVWLVETVGVLVVFIGVGLGISALRGRVSTEMAVIAATTAIGLATIEIIYVARGRIAAVYLLDAVIETAILALWATCWLLERRQHSRY